MQSKATELSTAGLPNLSEIDSAFEKVERAKQEWEATVDSLPELVCVVDDQGRVVRANRTIEAWQLGDVKAIQGFSLHTLLHPGCLGLYCELDRYLRRALTMVPVSRTEQLEAYDTFLHRHLQVRVQPVVTERPHLPITAVIVIEDITERRQNEEALRRSLTRLQALNDLHRAILAARSPEDIAQAALARLRTLLLFRQARVTLNGRAANDLVVLAADANGTTHLHPRQTCTSAEVEFGEDRRLTEEFSVTDLEQLDAPSLFEQQLAADGMRSLINVPLMVETEFVGSLLLASDRVEAFKTEQRQVAHEIGTLLAIAVHQARLYRQVKQANTQLRTALQAKEEIIANVSHELRTPLGLIYGYTALMSERELGPLTADQQQALGIMLKQAEQLRFMVERLVELRTIDATQLCRQPLDAAEWLTLVVKPWRKRAHLQSQTIQVELDLPNPPRKLFADPEALKQALDNLLDNALKFSPHGSAIRVQAKIDRDTVIVAVHDRGIGIPEDQLAQVFERFYQINGSPTRRYGGMGVGLALCREIVEAHGGRSWAESAGEGRGSTFFMALPLGQTTENAE
ncbi:MAG: PAS domain-containing protein [Chloroflexi bacterium]|nr:PAS domain-containing protein [Chloroflexota bacterium]